MASGGSVEVVGKGISYVFPGMFLKNQPVYVAAGADGSGIVSGRSTQGVGGGKKAAVASPPVRVAAAAVNVDSSEAPSMPPTDPFAVAKAGDVDDAELGMLDRIVDEQRETKEAERAKRDAEAAARRERDAAAMAADFAAAEVQACAAAADRPAEFEAGGGEAGAITSLAVDYSPASGADLLVAMAGAQVGYQTSKWLKPERAQVRDAKGFEGFYTLTTQLQVDGVALTVMTLQSGDAPEVRVEDDTVHIGGQALRFDGQRLHLGTFDGEEVLNTLEDMKEQHEQH